MTRPAAGFCSPQRPAPDFCRDCRKGVEEYAIFMLVMAPACDARPFDVGFCRVYKNRLVRNPSVDHLRFSFDKMIPRLCFPPSWIRMMQLITSARMRIVSTASPLDFRPSIRIHGRFNSTQGQRLSQRIRWRKIAETLKSPMSTAIDAYRSEIPPVN
jgi:hypothetical protein